MSGLGSTIFGGGVTAGQPNLSSTIFGGGVGSGSTDPFGGTGAFIAVGAPISGAVTAAAPQLVARAYQLGTSGLFWALVNVYHERGDIASILRGEAQTIEVRPSLRPARFPGGLQYGAVKLYPQPYFNIGITAKGGNGGKNGDSSTPGGSGAPAKDSPKRTQPSSVRKGRSRRAPRYCSKHRKFDWCWTK